MAHLTPSAHRWFATQHGVAAVAQLTASGLSRTQLKRLEEQGDVVGVLRGVYRSASVELDELGRCAAICLARPDVCVAGPTAGRLWGFRRLPRDRRIHVLAPPASNPSIAPWIVTYRTAAIHPCDVVERGDGIRLTGRARTAFDLTRTLQPDDLLSVIEQAMHDGKLTEQDMLDVAADWVTPGRPWARRYLRQFGRRLQGAAAESDPEVRFGRALERAGVAGLVRQFRVELPGYGPARFDLAVPELRWAVEVDVHPTHAETIGRSSDGRRDRAAAVTGWTVTRVSATAYRHDFAGAVRSALEQYRALRTAARRSVLPPR